jgi:SAM-dependent methyltransferase
MATGSDETAARIEREQSFHDVRFAEDADERSADKFYALVGPSQSRYDGLLAEFPTGSRVLELGCGLEINAWELLERGVDVTAIDISQIAIDQAADKAESLGEDRARFVHMNAEQLDYDAGSFDFVCGDGILHHLDLERALSGIAGVLTPDGRAVFSEPMGHNPAINFYRNRTPDQRTDDEHPLLMDDFDIFRRHFEKVELDFFHFTSLLALGLLKTPWFEQAAAGLERFDGSLFERFPSLRRFGWMVTINCSGPKQPR